MAKAKTKVSLKTIGILEKSCGKDQIRAIPSTLLAIGGVGCTNFLVFNEVFPLHFTGGLVRFATFEGFFLVKITILRSN